MSLASIPQSLLPPMQKLPGTVLNFIVIISQQKLINLLQQRSWVWMTYPILHRALACISMSVAGLK